MSTRAHLSPEEFGARLRSRAEARHNRAPQLTAERTSYRKAAALLWYFDPRSLRVPDEDGASVPRGGAVLALLDDSTARPSRRGLRWQLNPAVRVVALRSFTGPGEAQRYLAANPDAAPAGSTAALASSLLRGEAPDLRACNEQTLSRLREAVSWLGHVPGAVLPLDEQQIEEVLERRRLLQPLHALLDGPFEGRVNELDRVREHIGLLPARTWTGRIARVGRSAADLVTADNAELPLVVHGLGGIGKSTLLAKSLIEHMDDDRIEELPFVYVDSERATVSLHEPLSLLAEMARQLAVQYPGAARSLHELSASARVTAREQRIIKENVEDLRQVATTKPRGREASFQQHRSARGEEAAATRELGTILLRAVRSTPAPPFVVVLDSFEEAQYRASPVLDRMWSMFTALRESYPRTRLIVAGRAPVGHPTLAAASIPTLHLGDLDEAAARHFLVQRGVGPRLAEEINDRVGGNPLSLQLAARVAEVARAAQQDEEWILGVPARRRRFFGAVDDMLIQGMLYDRLLGHITNPEARELAHPGLALRRITPDLIRTVLGPICRVEVPDDTTAWHLFDELARELDLVERVSSSELRHRADVRRVMLRLLSSDRSTDVRAVEEAAVAYYETAYEASHDPNDRVEELYHRLRLGADPQVIISRWVPTAATALAGVQDELPRRSAKLLARLSQDPADPAETADKQVEWEQHTAAEVEDLLTQGYPEEARRLLRARGAWTPCSPLHALRAEVHLRLGETAEARRGLTEALETDENEQCGPVRLELLLLSARMHADAGDPESADADLDLAERLASRERHELDALGVLLDRARLHERFHRSTPDDASAEQALIRRVRSTDDAVLTRQPALLRAVAGKVGEIAPEVLAKAVALVGLPTLPAGAVALLARALVEAIDEDPAVAEVLADVAGQPPERWSHPEVGEVEALLDTASASGRLDEAARRLLATPDQKGSLAHGFAAAMTESSEVLDG